MPPRWNQALVHIASAKDPTTLPSDDRVLFYDDRTITIYDKFAKAQYHFLVLPRIPFKLHNEPAKTATSEAPPVLSAAHGKLSFGATSSNVVPASHLRNVSTLLASPYGAEVLEAVRKASDRVADYIRTDMQSKHGVTWDIERAFHAVPSMEHLHLHVTSMDLVSDRLKHKKHYFSFVPTVDFAQRLEDVESLVAQGKKALPRSEQAYEQLLRGGALRSHHTGQTFRFFPELKAHLESHWRNVVLAIGAEQQTSLVNTTPTKRGAPESDRSDVTRVLADRDADEHCARRRKKDSPKLEQSNATPSDSDEEPSLPIR